MSKRQFEFRPITHAWSDADGAIRSVGVCPVHEGKRGQMVYERAVVRFSAVWQLANHINQAADCLCATLHTYDTQAEQDDYLIRLGWDGTDRKSTRLNSSH